MTSLTGKTALVTGSTGGIGAGIAQSLARAGCAVMLNGVEDEKTGQKLAADLAAATGVKTAFDNADMQDPAAVRALVARTVAQLGGLDILVNNAGIQHVAPVESFPEDRWDAVIAINLSAAFHACKAALPHMRRAGWGRVVNIASAHGLRASANKSAYVAAKHGLVGLTKTIALETATEPLTCNAICPGWVRTPLVDRQIANRAAADGVSVDDAALALLVEKQPSLQFATAEMIGEMTVFLCSDAAAQITGAALSVDGGWTAR